MTIWENAEDEQWVDLSERTNAFVDRVAGREGLVVTVKPDTRPLKVRKAEKQKPPAGYYVRALGSLHIDASQTLPVGMEDLDLVNPLSAFSQRRYPAFVGVVVHESAHAKHSLHHAKHKNPHVKRWADLLEETRCESKIVTAFPQYTFHLKSSAIHILKDAFDNPAVIADTELLKRYTACSIAMLLLGRRDGGIFTAEEVENVEKACREVLEDDLDELREIWLDAQELDDEDIEGLVELAEKIHEIIDPKNEAKHDPKNEQAPHLDNSPKEETEESEESESSESSDSNKSDKSDDDSKSNDSGESDDAETDNPAESNGDSDSKESGKSDDGSESKDSDDSDGGSDAGKDSEDSQNSSGGSGEQSGESSDDENSEGSQNGSGDPSDDDSSDDAGSGNSGKPSGESGESGESQSSGSDSGSEESGEGDKSDSGESSDSNGKDGETGDKDDSSKGKNGSDKSDDDSKEKDSDSSDEQNSDGPEGITDEEREQSNKNREALSSLIKTALKATKEASANGAKEASEAGEKGEYKPNDKGREERNAIRKEGEKAEASIKDASATKAAGFYSFVPSIRMKSPDAHDGARARAIRKAIEKAQFREIDRTDTPSMIPPGKFSIRQAMNRSAQIASKQTPTATPWKQTRRREVDSPPIRLGVASDISGSMGPWQKEVSSFSWAVSHAVRGLRGSVGSVVWNTDTYMLMPNGKATDKIPVSDAGGGSTGLPSAIKAVDGMMDLTLGEGVRVLTVITDGYIEGHSQIQKSIDRMTRYGVKVMWILTQANGWRPKNVTVAVLNTPDDFGRVVGSKIVELLSEA